MTQLKIEKVPTSDRRSLPVFAEIDELMERIRARAYELARGRGFADQRALDDWLSAEREICWPAAELSEDESGYMLDVALPGFEASDVVITATPRELIVKAAKKTERRKQAAPAEGAVRWSEFHGTEAWRRVELPNDISVEKISATLHNGMLKIAAPKVPSAVVTPIRVEIAA
jgi:HSP20 family molecular chaperone IbpA